MKMRENLVSRLDIAIFPFSPFQLFSLREKRLRYKTATTSSAECEYGFSPYGKGIISKVSENTV
jgi:hypothetical protein